MMQKHFIAALMLCLLAVACKDEKNSEPTETSIEETLRREGYTRVLDAEEKEKLIQDWRVDADAKIKYRREQDNNKTWATLTTGIWEEDAIFEAGENNVKEVERGNWIRFGDDLRFERGYKSEIKSKGKYHYSPDTQLLILQYDDQNTAPEEYDARIANDMMVWSGQLTYKNNGTMMKLERRNSIPE